MDKILSSTFIITRGFLIILLFLAVGKVLSAQLPITFPGSIIALILLFSALSTRLIKLEWVLVSANLLLNYMVILFIPLAVGLLNYFELLLTDWIVILFSLFFGSLLIMLMVGHLFQLLNKRYRG